MQLRRLAALEREKIENEFKELVALIQDLEELLADDTKVNAVVRKETHGLKRKYGDERRTEVHPEELGDWRREDTEPHEEVVITLSRNGYVKRVKLDTYKKQHRGGKGVRGQRMTKEDDVTPHLQIADTHDYLLLFTDQGRVVGRPNAIIQFRAEGAPLRPGEPYVRGKVNEMLFWEQYSHEPYIAVCRFAMLYLGKPKEAREDWRVERGEAALDFLEDRLADRRWLAADRFTVADMALLAYTRLAPEGGFDLQARGNLVDWIGRAEKELGLEG